jgi:hypothetical protein
VLCPYPRHHHVRDRQRRTQLARSPMHRSVGRLPLQRPIQGPSLQSRRQLARPTSGMATEEPRQPLPPKPLAPTVDKRIVAVQLVPDLCPAMAAASSNISRARRPSSARPLRLVARWLSSTRSASVSPIVLLMNTTTLPFHPLQTTSYGSTPIVLHSLGYVRCAFVRGSEFVEVTL